MIDIQESLFFNFIFIIYIFHVVFLEFEGTVYAVHVGK
jgi:hypothetical protein